MSDEVEQIEPTDGTISEQWIRWTDEPDVRGVDAYTADDIDGWVVAVSITPRTT